MSNRAPRLCRGNSENKRFLVRVFLPAALGGINDDALVNGRALKERPGRDDRQAR